MAPDETATDLHLATPPAALEKPQGLHESPWFWLGLLFVVGLIIVVIPVNSALVAIAGALVAMLFHVVGTVQFAARATGIAHPWWRVTALMLVSVALWAASQFLVKLELYTLMEAYRQQHQHIPGWLSFIGQINYTARPLFLLMAAVFAGQIVARLVTSPNMLGPVCVIVALIDIWGVLFSGPVSRIMEKAPQVAAKAMASVPAVGAAATTGNIHVEPLQIGVGDYLFLGLLFAALHLNGMNWRGAIRWVTPLVALGLIGVFIFQIPLPGLLFIGLGIAIPNLRYFEYTREEKFALLYASIFVVILTVGVYFAVKRALPDKPDLGAPGNRVSGNRATTRPSPLPARK